MPKSAIAGKLQLKPGQTVLLVNASSSYVAVLDPLPEGAQLVDAGAAPVDVVHTFVKDSSELRTNVPIALASVKPDGVLWFSYPKGGSKVQTDLNRDSGWSIVMDAGWQPVRQIAVDELWSAVRFKATTKDAGDPLDKHFAGAKTELRPLYDEIAAAINALGDDIEVGIRESYIAFRRSKQFAVVKLAARPPQIELGLRLPEHTPVARLVAPGKSFGAESATDKIVLTVPNEFDDEVKAWLAKAYALA